MANACGSIAWFLSIVATGGILITLASKEWKKNSQSSSMANLNGVYSYEGLWVRCVSSTPGLYQCDNFDESFLSLPVSLQLMRAMMVVSALSAVAGVIAAALGMDCITAVGDARSKSKLWTGRTGGGLMVFAGLLTLASVSWYASEVVQEYNKQQLVNATFVYEFGSALYVGWVSSVLACVAGILLLCCNCGAADENDDDYPYSYGPAKPNVNQSRPNTEYV